MKKLIPAILIFAIFLGCDRGATNHPPPPPGGPPPPGMPPGGFPEGMPPPPPFNLDPHEKAVIYIQNGLRVPENEYRNKETELVVAEGATGISERGIEGILLTSADYAATGIVVAGGSYKIGGSQDYFTVIPYPENDYVDTKVAPGLYPTSTSNFNSVLLFALDTEITKDAVTGSSAIDAASDGEVVFLENVYLQVDGAQRYVSSTFGDATTVINDSYLVSTGNANGYTNDIPLPFSNEALLISGAARTNFTIGTSHTYYFNSTVIAEGWAALSTDASAGDGLDLYAYNTKAYALNGGYATYADFTCRVWLYGSLLEAAEVGGILSKSGEIVVLDGSSAPEGVMNYNTGTTTSEGSHVKAGRNAFMIHAPDMMGEGLAAADHGKLTIRKSTLETTSSLKSTFDYSAYGQATATYLDYIKGDVILIKSTSATVELEEVVLKSSNGVLFHTVLNSDRFGNFLAADDNKAVRPITLSLSEMSAEGAILHDDYQRNMQVNLIGTSLTGKVSQGSHQSWTRLWTDKGITKAQWLPDAKWKGTNELSVSLDSRSNWEVSETSMMTSLVIAEGATITAPEGFTPSLSVNGEEVAIAPGSFSGKVVLSISKD